MGIVSIEILKKGEVEIPHIDVILEFRHLRFNILDSE
jgi:hypothetical protein